MAELAWQLALVEYDACQRETAIAKRFFTLSTFISAINHSQTAVLL